MQKDKWGRPANSLNYGVEKFTAVEWDSTTTANVTYLRGDYADTCVIKRIDNATGKITWARGAWANRASLAYGNDRLLNVGV